MAPTLLVDRIRGAAVVPEDLPMAFGDGCRRHGETARIRAKEQIDTIPGQEAENILPCLFRAAFIVKDDQSEREDCGGLIDPESDAVQGLLPLQPESPAERE